MQDNKPKPTSGADAAPAAPSENKKSSGFKHLFKGKRAAQSQAQEAIKTPAKGRLDLKLLMSSRSNQALAISVLALALSLIAVSNQGSATANAFIAAENSFSERDLSDDKALNTPPAVKTETSTPTTAAASSSTPPANEPKGLTFADKNEFKQAVADAINALRRDETAKVMAAKFENYKNAQESVPQGRKIYGNPQARFLIQEFSDLECPFCKDFFAVPKEVVDLSNGQVAVEWIHTPLSFHEPAATREAIAAECVYEQQGNRAFWVAMQQIFDSTQSNGRGSKSLGRLVDDFGLNRDKYLTCINSQAMQERIKQHSAKATAAGVTGTPAVLITDNQSGTTRFLSGAQPASALMQAIEELNAQSSVTPAVSAPAAQGE